MTIEQQRRRIDLKLTSLLNKRQTWVTAQDISKLTEWDGNWLRRARERNYLKFRQRTGKSFEYLLETLPEQFIILRITESSSPDKD